VIRKQKVSSKSFPPKLELDQEKSKVGLGEIYEREVFDKKMVID
jgi:hypothetical protein